MEATPIQETAGNPQRTSAAKKLKRPVFTWFQLFSVPGLRNSSPPRFAAPAPEAAAKDRDEFGPG
jgi:hypothetical protein